MVAVLCASLLGWVATVFSAAGCATGEGPGACDEFDHAAFEALHRKLVPEEVSEFESIPWRIDLSEAREEARKSGQLIFLWSMNGHPLGCT